MSAASVVAGAILTAVAARGAETGGAARELGAVEANVVAC